MNCYAALLTPPGQGAIATIAVEGEDAARALARHFVPARRRQDAAHVSPTQVVRETDNNRLRFGHWLGEEVVLHRRAESRFEIHCHAGRASAGAILASLEMQGCELLQWRQFLSRSQPRLVRAEAIEALAAITTQELPASC